MFSLYFQATVIAVAKPSCLILIMSKACGLHKTFLGIFIWMLVHSIRQRQCFTMQSRTTLFGTINERACDARSFPSRILSPVYPIACCKAKGRDGSHMWGWESARSAKSTVYWRDAKHPLYSLSLCLCLHLCLCIFNSTCNQLTRLNASPDYDGAVGDVGSSAVLSLCRSLCLGWLDIYPQQDIILCISKHKPWHSRSNTRREAVVFRPLGYWMLPGV